MSKQKINDKYYPETRTPYYATEGNKTHMAIIGCDYGRECIMPKEKIDDGTCNLNRSNNKRTNNNNNYSAEKTKC